MYHNVKIILFLYLQRYYLNRIVTKQVSRYKGSCRLLCMGVSCDGLSISDPLQVLQDLAYNDIAFALCLEIMFSSSG